MRASKICHITVVVPLVDSVLVLVIFLGERIRKGSVSSSAFHPSLGYAISFSEGWSRNFA